jgi:cardiolipin synthase
MSNSEASVVVTGMAWMGSGIGSIESTLERLFREARHEILLTVYAASQGADFLFDWMESALARGVEIRLIINRLTGQPLEVVTRLQQFAQTYQYFHLYDFPGEERADLHAKVIIVDRRMALVGSSNLSSRAFLTNHELAVLVEGTAAERTAVALDRLISSRFVEPVTL